MSITRRAFPEVLDTLLTSISGGVAAEPLPFPPGDGAGPPFLMALQQPPVDRVVSVYGTRDGQPHLFRDQTDYQLGADRQTLEWTQGAELPDEGTLVYVNYVPLSAQPVLTDLQVGSVVRTLTESVALEIARLSAQLEAVYRSAFVDTASGSSLDNVVALLGISRVPKGRAAGEVEFGRVPGNRGAITLPADTRVTNQDGSVEYATTESVTLAPGQDTIRAVARDLEPNDPVPADTLTVLPVPVAGILRVTNPAPTALEAQDETDAELRTRAKNVLHGSERATLGAITQAITRQGLTADVVEPEGTPGFVEVTPHGDLSPEQQQRLEQAILDARPAGVRVVLKGGRAPRRVDLRLRLTTVPGLVAQDLRAAQRAVREKIEDYFKRLPAGEAGSVNRIVGLALSVPSVQDLRVVSATWDVDGAPQDVLDRADGVLAIAGFPTVLGDLDIADPGLATVLSVIATHPAAQAPPDSAALAAALTAALAYLNTLNAAELAVDAPSAEQDRRVLSYGKLLRVVPLPGKPGEPLDAFDSAAAAGSPPALPTEASVAPYTAQFVFVAGTGLSRILARSADPPYTLTPFERLALGSVEIRTGGGGA